MPRKQTQKSESTQRSTTNQSTDSEQQLQQRAQKKSRKQTTTQPETVPETVPETETTEDQKTSRVVPTRESVLKEFDDLVTLIETEINRLRDNDAKSKGVKFLRVINKRVKTLKTHSLRVSKQRQTTRRNNTNSGFLKPVQISKELATFTGWNQNEPRSRVDVTKFICNYIKTRNLQDPEDRRKIRVEDDQNLKKLLKFDSKDKKPLTYYSLQTYLKNHFVPVQQKN